MKMEQKNLKFLVDVGVSKKVEHWLLNQGYDATHLREEGLRGISDAEIIEKTRRENKFSQQK